MPAKKTVPISEAESVVMQVFWERGALPTEDVVAALESDDRWQEDNRRYIYSPVLTRDDWLATESHGFLDRMFGGRVAPLVSYFSQQKKLSKKDVEELKRLIEGLDDEN